MTGLPGKSWRLASAPSRMTRSPLASSCSVMRRPCSTVEGAEALVLGPDTADGTAGGVPLADFGDGAAQLGAYGLYERGAAAGLRWRRRR